MILKYNGYGMKKSEEVVYKATNKLCNTVAELIETLNWIIKYWNISNWDS